MDTPSALGARLAAIKARVTEPAPALRPAQAPENPLGTATLDGIRLLAKLTPEERRALERKCKLGRYAAGAVLIARFSPGTSVFFLLNGVARVVHNAGEEGEVTIATVGAGETLGEIAAIDGLSRSATILAESECMVAELPSADFGNLLASRADIGLDLLRRWASVIRQLDEKISFLATGSPDERVYAELVRLAKASSVGSDRWVIPDMPSHREIAVWAHTSREVVVRILAEIARTGVAQRQGKTLHIKDYDALRALASPPEAAPAADQPASA
jgi:CRP/FNR family transcriptional regulator, cyclic AMP receptor protein